MKPTRKRNYMTFQFEIVSAVKCQAFRFAIFHLRALFCVSLALKVISFDRVAVLTRSVAIFCLNL
jgi:hypothetical protein